MLERRDGNIYLPRSAASMSWWLITLCRYKTGYRLRWFPQMSLQKMSSSISHGMCPSQLQSSFCSLFSSQPSCSYTTGIKGCLKRLHSLTRLPRAFPSTVSIWKHWNKSINPRPVPSLWPRSWNSHNPLNVRKAKGIIIAVATNATDLSDIFQSISQKCRV